MGQGQYDPAFQGKITQFNRIGDLANYIPFSTYMPATVSDNMKFIGADTIEFAQSGEIFVATLNFGADQADQSRVRIRPRPTYPRPYPILPVHSPTDHELVYPEKVTFTSSPGVMRPSALGHVLQWIEHDILYTLTVEHNPRREAAVAIAQSLIKA